VSSSAVLNLLRATTGLSSPAKVTIFDVKRHAKMIARMKLSYTFTIWDPIRTRRDFSAVISDKHVPTRRISSSFFPDIKEALAKLRWSELD
jgi:hypothetical protein